LPSGGVGEQRHAGRFSRPKNRHGIRRLRPAWGLVRRGVNAFAATGSFGRYTLQCRDMLGVDAVEGEGS
jgi:hypothetical protein